MIHESHSSDSDTAHNKFAALDHDRQIETFGHAFIASLDNNASINDLPIDFRNLARLSVASSSSRRVCCSLAIGAASRRQTIAS